MKLIPILLSATAILWAGNVQVLPVEGGIDANLRSSVAALVRSSVMKAGETPVETAADVALRTNLLQLGASYTVIVERLEKGQVANSASMKASNAEELDIVIERSVAGALAGQAKPAQESIGNISEKEQNEMVVRKESRRFESFGLGPAKFWRMTPDDKVSYAIRTAYMWEVHPHAAVGIFSDNAMNFSHPAWHGNMLIGGRFYMTTTAFSPYVGAGFGFGAAAAKDLWAIGFDAGAQAGLLMFRTSGTQLEIWSAYDVIFSDGGVHKLAGGIAINY